MTRKKLQRLLKSGTENLLIKLRHIRLAPEHCEDLVVSAVGYSFFSSPEDPPSSATVTMAAISTSFSRKLFKMTGYQFLHQLPLSLVFSLNGLRFFLLFVTMAFIEASFFSKVLSDSFCKGNTTVLSTVHLAMVKQTCLFFCNLAKWAQSRE